MLSKKNNILIIGNGSGGHFYPSFTVANELNKLGYNIHYAVASNRLDEKIIKNTNYKYISLPYVGYNKNSVKFISQLFKNIKDIKEYIENENIKVIIGFGGGLSFSCIVAGMLNGCNVIVHEQNAVFGRANNLIKNKVHMLVSHKNIKGYKFVGNPVVNTNPIKKNNFFDIIIVFGSQGSQSLNNIFIEFLKEYKEKHKILFVSNTKHKFSNKNIVVKEYIKDLKSYFSNTRLVFTRGGATTLAELSCFECKVCIIPSPYVVNDHQMKNAIEFKKEYGSEIIREKDLTTEKINSVILNNLNEFKRHNNRIKIEKNNYLDLFIKEIQNEIS